ncbi:hypothetical protein DL769_005209 [Monosporascus sp. CRB-8-3]|nr:hypothetical protein DL769_005209 [Monosporascus sp. CRB-8-3]
MWGSHDDAAFALACKYPKLRLIVQELPKVAANSKVEAGLNGEFMAHDFFKSSLSRMLTFTSTVVSSINWSDPYCLKILKALAPALKQGSRVLVMDVVMPPPCVLPYSIERKSRAMDVTMLEVYNAKERVLNESKSLFEQANPESAFQGMQQPPGSNLAILEVAWEG